MLFHTLKKTQKSWNEKEKWLRGKRAYNQEISRYRKTDDNYWQNVRSISRRESPPRDRAKLFHRAASLETPIDHSKDSNATYLANPSRYVNALGPIRAFNKLEKATRLFSRGQVPLEPQIESLTQHEDRLSRNYALHRVIQPGPDVYKSLPQIFAD